MSSLPVDLQTLTRGTMPVLFLVMIVLCAGCAGTGVENEAEGVRAGTELLYRIDTGTVSADYVSTTPRGLIAEDVRKILSRRLASSGLNRIEVATKGPERIQLWVPRKQRPFHH